MHSALWQRGMNWGESVSWSAATATVRWIDCFAPTLHEFNPQDGIHRVKRLDLHLPVGMVVGTTDPGIIAAAHRNGVVLVDLASGLQTPVAEPERGRAAIAYNDAKVDPEARLWVATYDTGGIEPRGCLWVLEHGQPPRLAETGMAIVNGPAFSPDGRVIYVSDSIARRIVAFDVAGGALSGRRIFATMTPDEGLPDGLTVDAEGVPVVRALGRRSRDSLRAQRGPPERHYDTGNTRHQRRVWRRSAGHFICDHGATQSQYRGPGARAALGGLVLHHARRKGIACDDIAFTIHVR